jgi:hypothetical protein
MTSIQTLYVHLVEYIYQTYRRQIRCSTCNEPLMNESDAVSYRFLNNLRISMTPPSTVTYSCPRIETAAAAAVAAEGSSALAAYFNARMPQPSPPRFDGFHSDTQQQQQQQRPCEAVSVTDYISLAYDCLGSDAIWACMGGLIHETFHQDSSSFNNNDEAQLLERHWMRGLRCLMNTLDWDARWRQYTDSQQQQRQEQSPLRHVGLAQERLDDGYEADIDEDYLEDEDIDDSMYPNPSVSSDDSDDDDTEYSNDLDSDSDGDNNGDGNLLVRTVYIRQRDKKDEDEEDEDEDTTFESETTDSSETFIFGSASSVAYSTSATSISHSSVSNADYSIDDDGYSSSNVPTTPHPSEASHASRLSTLDETSIQIEELLGRLSQFDSELDADDERSSSGSSARQEVSGQVGSVIAELDQLINVAVNAVEGNRDVSTVVVIVEEEEQELEQTDNLETGAEEEGQDNNDNNTQPYTALPTAIHALIQRTHSTISSWLRGTFHQISAHYDAVNSANTHPIRWIHSYTQRYAFGIFVYDPETQYQTWLDRQAEVDSEFDSEGEIEEDDAGMEELGAPLIELAWDLNDTAASDRTSFLPPIMNHLPRTENATVFENNLPHDHDSLSECETLVDGPLDVGEELLAGDESGHGDADEEAGALTLRGGGIDIEEEEEEEEMESDMIKHFKDG